MNLKMLSERSLTQRSPIVKFHLHELLRIGKESDRNETVHMHIRKQPPEGECGLRVSPLLEQKTQQLSTGLMSEHSWSDFQTHFPIMVPLCYGSNPVPPKDTFKS